MKTIDQFLSVDLEVAMQDASRHLVHTAVSLSTREEEEPTSSNLDSDLYIGEDESKCEPLSLTAGQDLRDLTAALQNCDHDKLPKTVDQLQHFVDDNLGVVSAVVKAAKSNALTLTVLNCAGVTLRQKSAEQSEQQRELQLAGLWQSNEDEKRYEDSKNSYLGSKFIEWCFCPRWSIVILRIEQV